MEDYLASRIAFRNVLKDDADNVYREDVLYYIAMSSYKYASLSIPSKQKERYLVFVDDYFNLVGELPESRYRKELDVIYRKAQKALGKDAVHTEDADMSEKDFAKERRRIEKENKKSK
jgi:outer membrane protein assembly factor BamD